MEKLTRRKFVKGVAGTGLFLLSSSLIGCEKLGTQRSPFSDLKLTKEEVLKTFNQDLSSWTYLKDPQENITRIVATSENRFYTSDYLSEKKTFSEFKKLAPKGLEVRSIVTTTSSLDQLLVLAKPSWSKKLTSLGLYQLLEDNVFIRNPNIDVDWVSSILPVGTTKKFILFGAINDELNFLTPRIAIYDTEYLNITHQFDLIQNKLYYPRFLKPFAVFQSSLGDNQILTLLLGNTESSDTAYGYGKITIDLTKDGILSAETKFFDQGILRSIIGEDDEGAIITYGINPLKKSILLLNDSGSVKNYSYAMLAEKFTNLGLYNNGLMDLYCLSKYQNRVYLGGHYRENRVRQFLLQFPFEENPVENISKKNIFLPDFLPHWSIQTPIEHVKMAGLNGLLFTVASGLPGIETPKRFGFMFLPVDEKDNPVGDQAVFLGKGLRI